MTKNLTATCEAVGKLNLTGNITPTTWYKTIRHRTTRNSAPHLLAINILADVVFWYRPTEVRDEITGNLTGYKKKFAADKLQRNYTQISEFFGVSYKIAMEACKFLEDLGILILEFRNIKMASGTLQNVCFMDLNIVKLIEYTYPTDDLIATMSELLASPIRKEPFTESVINRLPNSVNGVNPNGKSATPELGNIYIGNLHKSHTEITTDSLSSKKSEKDFLAATENPQNLETEKEKIVVFSAPPPNYENPAPSFIDKSKKAKKPKDEPNPAERPNLHAEFIKIYQNFSETVIGVEMTNSLVKPQTRGFKGLRIAVIEVTEAKARKDNNPLPTDGDILFSFQTFLNEAWKVSDNFTRGKFSPNYILAEFGNLLNKIRNNRNGKSTTTTTPIRNGYDYNSAEHAAVKAHFVGV